MVTKSRSQLSDGDRLILATVEVPQANDLLKVFDVARLVSHGANTAKEVADGLAMVEREGAYYLAAARALRLVRTVPGTPTHYIVGYLGEEFLATPKSKRASVVVRGTLIAPHVVFVAEQLGLSTPLSTPTPRELHDITVIERELADIGPLGGGTPRRRATTLVSWLRTIDKLARQVK